MGLVLLVMVQPLAWGLILAGMATLMCQSPVTLDSRQGKTGMWLTIAGVVLLFAMSLSRFVAVSLFRTGGWATWG